MSELNLEVKDKSWLIKSIQRKIKAFNRKRGCCIVRPVNVTSKPCNSYKLVSTRDNLVTAINWSAHKILVDIASSSNEGLGESTHMR